MAGRTDEAQLPRWKRALFWSILLVGGYGLLDVAAVAYLKAFHGYDGTHLVQYEFDPYKNILPTPNYRDTRGIQHNSAGFRRSAEVAINPPPNTYRIFLMGASTAYGLGGLWQYLQPGFEVVRNSETIDAYLEQELRRTFPDRKFEVINAAITSTWTHHHLIYLNQTLLKYHPDMVLFLDGYNDHYFFDRSHDQFASFAYQEQANGILGEPTLKSLLQANAWWLYRKSALAYVSIRAFRDVGTAVGTVIARRRRVPMEVQPALAGLHEVFGANALKMVERNVALLRHEGVAPVVILQPMLILERNRKQMPPSERTLFEYDVKANVPGYEDFILQGVPWVRDTLRAVVTARGGLFLDATGIYGQASGQVFTDYVHLTPKANELLAQFVAAQIVPVIRRGRQPVP